MPQRPGGAPQVLGPGPPLDGYVLRAGGPGTVVPGLTYEGGWLAGLDPTPPSLLGVLNQSLINCRMGIPLSGP